MAYNNLSGTVILPDLLTTRLNPVSGSIISGNLDFSDGANIINVPRLDNAVDNAIITNVNGDFNSLTCESNLTFNGSALAVTGQVSASLNISASFFYGNGLKITGGLTLNRRLVTSTITASVNDYFIGINSSGGAFEIRLLGASALDNGQMLVVKDENGSTGTNNVTIRASGSQTIDGKNSIVLESPNASVQLYCDGTSKYFIF